MKCEICNVVEIKGKPKKLDDLNACDECYERAHEIAGGF